MGQFPELKTTARKTVSQPEGLDLFKGLAWMAAGITGISFIATSVPNLWKMILVALGIDWKVLVCLQGIQTVCTHMGSGTGHV